ncbi:hypothetical protein ABZ070_04395 [Streptomyces sp. NPDC006283]|uniref:hypothetical protein n=1 Tax=Streptomyces sp. NPDC006283 TaxID=3156741 RepID=UPI0033B5EAF3
MTASRRTPVLLTACAVAVLGVTACEPAAGGLNSAAVAITTDRTATSTLERLTFDVAWFSCTGKADASPVPAASGTPAPPRSVTVDCRGETGSGQVITLTGKVTEERAGTCVRGDMTARVDKKVVFRATMLGTCDTAAPGSATPRTGQPRPTVTVTVTETVTAVPAK